MALVVIQINDPCPAERHLHVRRYRLVHGSHDLHGYVRQHFTPPGHLGNPPLAGMIDVALRIPRDRNDIDIFPRNSLRLQAPLRGQHRELRAHFFAVEPLFGRCGNDPAIDHEGARRKVCVRINR